MKKSFLIILLGLVLNCNDFNEISNELRGCRQEPIEYIPCLVYLESVARNNSTKEQIDGCLIPIYFHEKCKKRLQDKITFHNSDSIYKIKMIQSAFSMSFQKSFIWNLYLLRSPISLGGSGDIGWNFGDDRNSKSTSSPTH